MMREKGLGWIATRQTDWWGWRGKFFTTGNTAKRIAKYYIFALVNQIIAIMSEILARIPKNLTSSPVLGEKKEWVLGAASLALGIGSSLFGANKAKKAARRAQAENQYRTNAEKAWYDKNYNTDYLDTKAGQNLMRRAQEVQDEYIRKADGAAAVGGGTAASVAQAKESANKAMGDTIANIAAQDTSRKQHVEDAHLANTQQLSRERQQIEQQKAQNTSDAAQNASNALVGFGVNQLGSELEGAKAQGSSKLGGSASANDNKNVTQTPKVSPTAIAYEAQYGKGAAKAPIPAGYNEVGQQYDPLDLATGAKKRLKG